MLTFSHPAGCFLLVSNWNPTQVNSRGSSSSSGSSGHCKRSILSVTFTQILLIFSIHFPRPGRATTWFPESLHPFLPFCFYFTSLSKILFGIYDCFIRLWWWSFSVCDCPRGSLRSASSSFLVSYRLIMPLSSPTPVVPGCPG